LIFDSDNPVLGIQEDNLEDFPLLISEAMVEIIEKLFGRPDRIFSDESLLQVSLGNCPDQLDSKDVLGADPLNLLEFLR